MRSLDFRNCPDLGDVFLRPHAWRKLSRAEAIRYFQFQPVAVVNPSSGLPVAQWLDRGHPSLRGNGPYPLNSFRFFLLLSAVAKTTGSAGGKGRPAEPISMSEPVELAPGEEPQPVPEKKRTYKWRVRLDIDPKSQEHNDDTFCLLSMDDGKTYKQIRTAKNDKKPGDDYLDLEFTDLKEGVRYVLEIDEGKEGGKYRLFENQSYAQLRMLSPLDK